MLGVQALFRKESDHEYIVWTIISTIVIDLLDGSKIKGHKGSYPKSQHDHTILELGEGLVVFTFTSNLFDNFSSNIR